MTDQQALLGQILKNNDVYYKASPCDWWFPDPKDRSVFTAIESALDSGLNADLMTIAHCTDSVYASSLTSIPTTANWKHFASRCKSSGAKAELRGLMSYVKDEIEGKKASEIIETINDTIEKIVSNSSDYRIMSIKECLLPIVKDIEERYNKRGTLLGLQTGFQTVDDITCGLQDGRLYLLGARPSQGKSAMALNIAGSIANHSTVGILSLESSWKEIIMRDIASEAKVNSQNLSSGYISQSGMAQVVEACERISSKNMFIYDKPNCSLVEVIGQCRRMVNRLKCNIIFIDYLQLVQTKADSDRERVAHVSKRLKDLARELKVPIVALAQLRRDSDGRRPGLGDFQHSSQLEQDADVGMLIYHQVCDKSTGAPLKKSKVDDEDKEEVHIYLLIDKNRDGRTGAVRMHFRAETVTFEEWKN